jgi:hypothetical protein
MRSRSGAYAVELPKVIVSVPALSVTGTGRS